MNLHSYFERARLVTATTQQLRAAGFTERALAEAVRAGSLVRVRRGNYVLCDTDEHVREAIRVGGRLACVSAASVFGIFVLDASETHVHLDRARSRLRMPKQHRVERADGARSAHRARNAGPLHWVPLLAAETAAPHIVGVRDCLAQIVRCQEPRMAIAALDSALFQRLIDDDGLREIFASLPKRCQPLLARVNGRSESGQESVLRLIVEEMGLSYAIQVPVDGVGRVDMIIEGVLVVEADSRAHHKDWSQHVRDRTRDRLVAMQGYMTLRLLYRDIMFDAEGVRTAIRGLLAAHAATVEMVARTP